MVLTWEKNNEEVEFLAEVGSEKTCNTHVKAEISFCIGKSYRRRCSSKVRAIEMRKLGQAHSLPPVWYWKESKQEPSDVEGKKADGGTCVLSGVEKRLGEKEGFEISGKHLWQIWQFTNESLFSVCY